MTDLSSRQTLRSEMRHFRRSLTSLQQRQAGLALKKNLALQPIFIRSKAVALYLPNDGEIDTKPLLELALSMGKQCFLPALTPGSDKGMRFIRYFAHSTLRPNRFGILEPKLDLNEHIKAPQLDLVLMPLVAFDQDGGRLGMGGGYYDRSFAFKKDNPQQKPYLLGLAHDGQQCESLPLEAWDIPLCAIVTDKRVVISREQASSKSSQRNFR